MLDGAQVHPTLPASDIERAKAWYKDKLGLTPTEETPGGLIFGGGATEFTVYPSQFAGTNQATSAEFRVDDIAATVASLGERGVVFQEYDLPGIKTEGGIASIGEFKGAWFKDSEGNILAVVQRGP